MAHILNLLNQRHNYGVSLILLSIDEGISGYRDDSLESVKRNMKTFGLPLKILSYQVFIVVGCLPPFVSNMLFKTLSFSSL